MDKKDYVHKFEEMIKAGIRKGVYVTTTDTTWYHIKNIKSVSSKLIFTTTLIKNGTNLFTN